MLKTKAQNPKLLSHRNLSQVELVFNSNDDLNILLGENSKNIDKLNEIIDVEISFFGNKLLIVGKKHNVELAENLIKKVYDILLINKNNVQNIDFSIFVRVLCTCTYLYTTSRNFTFYLFSILIYSILRV